MWAAVLVLLSLCSSAQREEEEEEEEGGWWETNKPSIQLLEASDTHDARRDSDDRLTKNNARSLFICPRLRSRGEFV